MSSGMTGGDCDQSQSPTLSSFLSHLPPPPTLVNSREAAGKLWGNGSDVTFAGIFLFPGAVLGISLGHL